MPLLLTVPDKEKNYQGYMVYVLVLIWTGVISLIVSAGFFFFPHLWKRWLIFIGIALLIGGVNLTLNYLSHTRTAGWLFPFMLWAFISISAYSSGGVMSPVILSQLSVIITAGFLLGGRGGTAFALLCVTADFALAYMQLTGKLPVPAVQHTPITYCIGALIAFGTITALQYYATNHLSNSLASLQHEIGKREEAEKDKDKVLHTVAERMKELKTLYSVSRLLQDEKAPVENLFSEVAGIIPAGFQYPHITAARIWLGGNEYTTANYHPSEYHLRAEMPTGKNAKVGIEVVCLSKMPAADEGPFLKEERSLINMLVEMLKIYVERQERTAELLEYKYALDEAAIVSIADVNACFTHVNDNFCRATKYTRSELLGKHHSILWSGLHSAYSFDELKKFMQGGEPYKGEFCNKAKDGTLYWVDSAIVPFLDNNGKIYQYLSINYDITERKEADLKLRISEETTRHIMNSALDAIVCMNTEGMVTVWTPQCETMFGWKQEEAIGKKLSELIIPHKHRVAHEEGLKRYLQHGTRKVLNRVIELSALNKNSTEFPIELTIVSVQQGSSDFFCAFVRDITERKKAEEKIKNSEEKNRAIIDNMSNGLVLFNSNLDLIYQSPSVEGITGYTLEERTTSLPGAYSVIFADDKPILKGVVEKALAAPGLPVHYQIRAIHKTGKIVWLDVSLVNLLDNPSVNAIMANYSDVTDKKEAEEKIKNSEAKNRAMIENMWDGLILLDANMEVIYQSPSVERITGYTLEERKNKQSGAYTLVYPGDEPILKNALVKALANPNVPVNYQIRAIHKSGSIVWLDVNMINLLGKSGVEAIMVNYSDITEKKVAEEKINALNESLEQKVVERTAQLEEANQMLESFSYSVSHDLRAPVRNISSFAQLLDKMMGETISAQQKEIVTFIKDGADKMSQLISDLLEFSRADRHNIKIEEVNMNELVHSAIKGLNGTNTLNTKFTVTTLPHVHGDKALLQQVWINLVSNAVKYSGKKDSPQVEVGTQTLPGETVFYIKDNGAGFDMKNTEKLFGVFQRLHSSKEFEGTGVGLSIVKRIIQKHGGRIWAEAKLNEGATFYFTLPQNHN